MDWSNNSKEEIKKYSKLYTKDTYTAPILYCQGKIREYDMSSAGLSILKEYNLATNKEIKRLESLSKKELVRDIGIMQIDNKVLANKIKEGFVESRRKLFEANLIEDRHILSIKKDAIFTRDKFCSDTEFGNIKFRVKNKYTSFLQLNEIEFFYNEMTDVLDVKGINDNLLHLHENGMIKVIKDVLNWASKLDEETLVQKIQKLVTDYKEGNMNPEVYREFNRVSQFKSNTKLAFCGNVYSAELENLGDTVDKSYNFMKFIVPLIHIFYI